jgi:addiction module HigA family antidote
MASSDKLKFEPEFAVPPGETLAEVLEATGMTQAELARRMGRPTKTINEIIQGRAAITAATALQLEHVLGLPASFWNARESNYREALARIEERRTLEQHLDWLNRFPAREMARWGWIGDVESKLDKLRELLRFFGIASPAEWEAVWGKPQAAFRRSSAFESDACAVSAWLRQGERQALEIDCTPFDRATFLASLKKIRELTTTLPDTFCRELPAMAARSGVVVAFVPELPRAPISGATRWLTTSKALIQLSLRYKTDDHLWFTFFHEAGHIALHGKSAVFIEGPARGGGPEEAEANEFAQDWLIPPDRYQTFTEGKVRFSKVDIASFAASIGVSPGIVVGRLQHDKKLPLSHCNDLRLKLAWKVPGRTSSTEN